MDTQGGIHAIGHKHWRRITAWSVAIMLITYWTVLLPAWRWYRIEDMKISMLQAEQDLDQRLEQELLDLLQRKQHGSTVQVRNSDPLIPADLEFRLVTLALTDNSSPFADARGAYLSIGGTMRLPDGSTQHVDLSPSPQLLDSIGRRGPALLSIDDRPTDPWFYGNDLSVNSVVMIDNRSCAVQLGRFSSCTQQSATAFFSHSPLSGWTLLGWDSKTWVAAISCI
ncbi:MAG: hypothetical protein H7A35_03640 [Planctomycetales bacterium]|nr:hypothetical protein [bacterium]UNM09148.1 MAG: hypothetical protein H7A35_03640 [Planctomycetales bacterium]